MRNLAILLLPLSLTYPISDFAVWLTESSMSITLIFCLCVQDHCVSLLLMSGGSAIYLPKDALHTHSSFTLLAFVYEFTFRAITLSLEKAM
jgi:hypothetical protein